MKASAPHQRDGQELHGGEPAGEHDAALPQSGVKAARSGRRHAPPVAIDDHDVLWADLVAHAVILAPSPACQSRVIDVHGTAPASPS